MNIPETLFYTKEHEWARIEGNSATVGITDYAQHSLGDITFVELPKLGIKLEKAKCFSTVESVKAASDIYAPVSGTVVKINDALSGAPEAINQSPYDSGWIAVVEMSNAQERHSLLPAAEYKKYLEGLK